MCIYADCFSVIKSYTYWDSSTLQALHEQVAVCSMRSVTYTSLDRVGKLPSNMTV